MLIAVRDGAIFMQHHHQQVQRLHQIRQALFGGIQFALDRLEIRDVAAGSPDAQQHAVFDNAPLAAQACGGWFPSRASGESFDGAEVVPGANGVERGLAHARVGDGRQVADAPAGQLSGFLETELAGQGVVAFGEIAVSIDLVDLLLLRQSRSEMGFSNSMRHMASALSETNAR